MEEKKPNSLLEQTVIQQGIRIEKLENLYHGIVLTSKEDKFDLQKLIADAVQQGLESYSSKLFAMEEEIEKLKLAEYTRTLQDKSQSGMKGIAKELFFPIVKAIVYLLIAYAIAKIYGINI